MTRRALVMSGGGAKGAFELGAVHYLVNDLGLDFDVIAGVSAGALHAAILAQGSKHAGLKAQLALLKDQWFAIKGPRDNFRTRILGKVLPFIWTKSMYDPTPVRKKLERYVSDQKLRDSGKEFRVVVVSLETGDDVPIDQRMPGAASWTLASGSIPLAFPPVLRNGQAWVDGGVRNITPFREAFKALKEGIADSVDLEMFMIFASPFGVKEAPETRRWNGREIALRAVAILENEIYCDDIRYALDVNASVRIHAQLVRELAEHIGSGHPLQAALTAHPFRPPKYRSVKLWGVVPGQYYMDTLDFDPVKIRLAFDAGRDAAMHPLDETALRAALDRKRGRGSAPLADDHGISPP